MKENKKIDWLKVASSSYKITIESENVDGRKILSNIIRSLLENDYSFRTLYASSKIIIDDIECKDTEIKEEYEKLKTDKKESKRE